MVDNDIKNALFEQMDRMPISMQKQVLNFAQSLNRPRPQGTPISKFFDSRAQLVPKTAMKCLKLLKKDASR